MMITTMMKIVSVVMLLAGYATALPRGARNKVDGLRGDRRLMQDKVADSGGGGGGGGGDGIGVAELHPCEPDPVVARNWVDVTGGVGEDSYQAQYGNEECYDDPENACDGGCCRFGHYFICDTSNGYGHLACVCNGNSATRAPTTPAPTAPPTEAPVATTAAPSVAPIMGTEAPVFGATGSPVTPMPTVNMTTMPSNTTTNTTMFDPQTEVFPSRSGNGEIDIFD